MPPNAARITPRRFHYARIVTGVTFLLLIVASAVRSVPTVLIAQPSLSGFEQIGSESAAMPASAP